MDGANEQEVEGRKRGGTGTETEIEGGNAGDG